MLVSLNASLHRCLEDCRFSGYQGIMLGLLHQPHSTTEEKKKKVKDRYKTLLDAIKEDLPEEFEVWHLVL